MYPNFKPKPIYIQQRASKRYALARSQFQREFAEFVDFIGASAFDRSIRKVENKLKFLSPSTRGLYRDRYFFHQQCIRFEEGAQAFQLNLSDTIAVRTASLIAGFNRMKKGLSVKGASKLRAMMIDNLKPDRDIRQIEHEIRCATHFGLKGYKITCADLEGLGNYDFLIDSPFGQFEVECKTVSEETGSQLKTDLMSDLFEIFRRRFEQLPPVTSGIFVLSLRKPADQIKTLKQQFQSLLRCSKLQSVSTEDFSFEFTPQPSLINSNAVLQLSDTVSFCREITDHPYCAMRNENILICLTIRPHKPSTIAQQIVNSLKKAADQCSAIRPSALWLHFVGVAEEEFLPIAQFSLNNGGAGLNSLVAHTLHPDATSTNRSHVNVVWFSATGSSLQTQTSLAPNLVLTPSVSLGGGCYEVLNPFSKFSELNDRF